MDIAVSADGLFQEASAHFAAGPGPARCAKRCGRLLTADAQHPDGLNLRAIVACAEGDFSAAGDDIAAAIRYGGETALRLRNQCEILRRAGDVDGAVAAGRRAVAIDPRDGLARTNLAMALLDLPDPQGSAAMAAGVIAAAPDDSSAHFCRAQALLLQGDFRRRLA